MRYIIKSLLFLIISSLLFLFDLIICYKLNFDLISYVDRVFLPSPQNSFVFFVFVFYVRYIANYFFLNFSWHIFVKRTLYFIVIFLITFLTFISNEYWPSKPKGMQLYSQPKIAQIETHSLDINDSTIVKGIKLTFNDLYIDDTKNEINSEGNQRLIVEMTFENLSEEQQEIDKIAVFHLLSDSGNKYYQTSPELENTNNTLIPGEIRTIIMNFEVIGEESNDFTLRYQNYSGWGG